MAWIRERKTKDGRIRYAVQWRDDQDRVRSKTLQTTDPRLLEIHLRAAEKQEGKPGRTIKPAGSALTLLQRYLDERSLQVSAPTAQIDRNRLTPWVRAWRDKPIPDWSRADLVAYVKAKRWSARTTQMTLAAIRRFTNWLRDTGVPCPEITFKAPTVRYGDPVPLDPAEVARLLASAREHYLEVPIALAACAGLSLSDLRALDWSEIDLTSGWIARRRSKTQVAIRVPIIPLLRDVLERNRATAGPVCRGLPKSSSSLRKALHRKFARAEVPPAHGAWHRLRHSFGFLLQRAGADVPTVGRAMAHRPGSSVTLRYQHSNDSLVADALLRVNSLLDGAEPTREAS